MAVSEIDRRSPAPAKKAMTVPKVVSAAIEIVPGERTKQTIKDKTWHDLSGTVAVLTLSTRQRVPCKTSNRASQSSWTV